MSHVCAPWQGCVALLHLRNGAHMQHVSAFMAVLAPLPSATDYCLLSANYCLLSIVYWLLATVYMLLTTVPCLLHDHKGDKG